MRMTKGIIVFIVFMAVTITSPAGEKTIKLANIGTDSTSGMQKGFVPPVVKEKYEYYEVCGCCETDINSDLKQKCIKWTDGNKYDSVTNWKLKWDYSHSSAAGACAPDSFTVTVDITFQLPKWVRTADAPQSLADKWDRYIKKLLAHEQGHRDIAVEAANELTRSVGDLPPSRTCAELDRSVQAMSHERMNKLIDDQKRYDTVTNHGRTQGAVFP